jgi:hypothetical protein
MASNRAKFIFGYNILFSPCMQEKSRNKTREASPPLRRDDNDIGPYGMTVVLYKIDIYDMGPYGMTVVLYKSEMPAA